MPWPAQGVRFERAYAQAPHTSFSVASLLTGTYYASLARLGQEGSAEPLSLLLRQQGWTTAAFYPPAVFFVDGDKLQRYASNHFHFEHVRFDYLNAQARLKQVTAFFEQQKPDRVVRLGPLLRAARALRDLPGTVLRPARRGSLRQRDRLRGRGHRGSAGVPRAPAARRAS